MPAADLSQLNVAFVAGTLGQGGAERQLYYMLRELKRNGASPVVLSLTAGEFWEPHIRKLGVEVIWVGKGQSKLERLRSVARALGERRPALVQSAHFYTNLYSGVAGRMLGIRDIGAIRNDVRHEIGDTGAVNGRLSCRVPRMLVANSRAAIRTAVECGVSSKRIRLLPNVVDIDQFVPLPMSTTGGPIRLLSPGRLVEQKRHDRFLRALSEVRRQTGLDVRGIIVGDGPLRAPLMERAGELGLKQGTDIQFRPATADISAAYGEADVVVLASDYEGTPNVVLEAMACSRPVVATSVGGVPDLIEDGRTGFMFAPEDSERLVSILSELSRDQGLRSRIADSARAHAVATWSTTSLGRRLSEIYGEVRN